MKKVTSIHFVGIKGVGMTPLAIIAKEAGVRVSGSDVEEKFITDVSLEKAGIRPVVGFKAENLPPDTELVITTGAHGGFYNPEVVAAKAVNIPVLTKGQAVGEYMRGEIFGKSFTGIAVAGSHGKTTTTAMVATLLKEQKMDPSYIIGTSQIPSLGLSGHFGKGKYFIAESDEYATEPKHDHTAQFLWQRPKITVFTNIEHDHPDIYPTVDDVRRVFLEFANLLPDEGVLITCGDDGQIRRLLREYNGRVITYGFSESNDYSIKRLRVSGPQTFFWVDAKGTSLGEFSLRVVGEHNGLNALATVLVGLEVGIPLDAIKKNLRAFAGTKRRLEFLGELTSGAHVFDDYAHHPTEIKSTLKALKGMYPGYRIHAFFQPHTFSRTKSLFREFGTAFTDSDSVLLLPIFASAREDEDETVSSESLAVEIKKHRSSVKNVDTLEGMVEYISENNFGSKDVLVLMGAGDIYKVAERLSFRSRSTTYG
jgi:UDP-N-acetylmuramate--alanine ligase